MVDSLVKVEESLKSQHSSCVVTILINVVADDKIYLIMISYK